ncbi:conserved hypothetical protein [Ricinus communis]|uniref:Uncharacterized protein n=1 Tax=Ricinus communis TaxID=3988 RepID=B9TK17_RICCO|nr:conserved hypothetical protein [Ricinus communis]
MKTATPAIRSSRNVSSDASLKGNQRRSARTTSTVGTRTIRWPPGAEKQAPSACPWRQSHSPVTVTSAAHCSPLHIAGNPLPGAVATFDYMFFFRIDPVARKPGVRAPRNGYPKAR